MDETAEIKRLYKPIDDIPSYIEREMTSMNDRLERSIDNNHSDIYGLGYTIWEDDYDWAVNRMLYNAENLIEKVDVNTEIQMDELYWDLEKIMPSDPPDPIPELQLIKGLLEQVTVNQVNIAFSANSDANDIIDAIEKSTSEDYSEYLTDIEYALDDVSDAITDTGEASYGFIGACLDGVSDNLTSVGDTIVDGISATTRIIEPALFAIGEVWELMFEKLILLLKSLFSLDPTIVTEYMSMFYDAYHGFVKSRG